MTRESNLGDTFSRDDVPVSRRQFVRLSAATAGAVSLTGSAVADSSSPKVTDLYAFVVDAVDDSFEIPTLVETTDAAAFEDLRGLGLDPVTTREPTTAAYVRPTPDRVESIVAVDGVTTLRYSPGSNPFWRLGHYPDGVFPAVDDSVDYIDFEQMVDGMQRLQGQHEDRLQFYSIGESPGHYNLFLDEAGPQNLWVAEVTNDVGDEAAFREKETVVYTLGIHGDERAGAEAGTRFVERVLNGDEPAVESLLDEVVLVFLYPNPDGWVSRNPQYRVDTDGDGTAESNSFKRVTATGVDPNRQYPTVGWINTSHYPAEPAGADLQDDTPGVDEDVPAVYEELVPDALDIVEHLRGYDNLRIGSDLHGMFWSSDFVNGLVVNDQYDTGEFHDLYEYNRATADRLEAALDGKLEAAQSKFEALNDAYGEQYGFDGSSLPTPQEAFSYGTILDTIGYTTSGTLISWMSHPEENGGLGMQIMAHEMGWDNRVFDRMTFRPWLVDLQVTGYREVIQATAEHAVRSVTAEIETGRATTAYVETEALERESADLSFTDATRRTRTQTVAVGGRPEPVTVDVSATATSLSLTVEPERGMLVTRLRDPEGRVVRTHALAAGDRSRVAEWVVDDPAAGTWTVEVKATGATETDVTVRSTLLVGDGSDAVSAPDPVDVLGYEQRPYSVTPLTYFDDYAEFVADAGATNGRSNGRRDERGSGPLGQMAPLGVEAVADGALFRGDSDRLAVENLVVSHAVGVDDDGYVAELDRFVEAGGNLVLTDRGVSLLGRLSNALVDDVGASDVEEIRVFSAFLDERVDDHPLLAGTRSIQRELWKPAPLGYPISIPGTAPLTVVDPDAFTAAGGSVAGYARDDDGDDGRRVAAGSLTRPDGTGVHLLGGLLPPANQSSLHPFGVLEYTTTFLGHTMLTNALGYRQRRVVDGDLVETFGDVR
ncbi:Zinc carboxypeptidase [Halogranum amylolyticum]|uniref:Zinc carboxypeptidase n=1 Tax=Halogranum amylolyticum TaxID=660520 RepID=A0A1H8S1S1_9EURY|nr:M14 family zinc carboxypeptidase [Halogranum amylolyticum]SEO72899.1 Zinc carboxypeptidase [Halogranum amylolyticum]